MVVVVKHHQPSKCLFGIGDQVRVARVKAKFEQGYLQNWSDEIFVVMKCVQRKPPVYKLKDVYGEDVDGSFYS